MPICTSELAHGGKERSVPAFTNSQLTFWARRMRKDVTHLHDRGVCILAIGTCWCRTGGVSGRGREYAADEA